MSVFEISRVDWVVYLFSECGYRLPVLLVLASVIRLTNCVELDA